MKKIIIFLIFSSQLLMAQQNIEVTYLIKYNTEMPNSRTGSLQIDFKQNKSVFRTTKGNLASGATQKGVNIRVIHKSVEGYVVIDKSKDSLKTKIPINNSTYLVLETIPVFKWVMDSKESKKIGNYVCKKATTTFRGRNYIAWYAVDIPTQFGPWKFNGLPGLILEAYDETYRYHWTTQKIKTLKEKIEMPKYESYYTKIDLRKYAELRYESPLTYNNARLPRGSYTVKTFKAPRNDKEIKFEWEE